MQKSAEFYSNRRMGWGQEEVWSLENTPSDVHCFWLNVLHAARKRSREVGKHKEGGTGRDADLRMCCVSFKASYMCAFVSFVLL